MRFYVVLVSLIVVAGCGSEAKKEKGSASQTISQQVAVSDVPKQQATEFQALFNGKDLTGWRDADKHGDAWKVEDGVIHFTGKEDSNLVTVKNYKDFELKVDWKITTWGDCGIYLRGKPEVKIWNNKVGSGGLHNNSVGCGKEPLVCADNEFGQWNTFYIRMVGDKVTVRLNDKIVVDNAVMLEGKVPPEGPIELGAHSPQVWFRNLLVRELPSSEVACKEQPQASAPQVTREQTATATVEPDFKGEWQQLFSGKDLTGWHATNYGSWRAEDGILTGGGESSKPGYLYTARGNYDDFHLRIEAKTNEKGNSGVFFRYDPNDPGEKPHGYEAQIYSVDGGRFVTGSLYGFAAIEKNIVQPNEWFTMEVIAKGNHIMIKVNGTTTVNYVDTDNTYKVGHIGLQLLHSPKPTLVQFRKVEIKEPTQVVQNPASETSKERPTTSPSDQELARFIPIDIRKVATVSSARIFNEESLRFPQWGNQTFHSIPFVVSDPEGGNTKNTICLYSERGAISRNMPGTVRLPCDLEAKKVHFLGASGWGAPWTRGRTLSMVVRFEFADGEQEDHRLLNEVHLTDWAKGSDVPRSKNIGVEQVRYFSIAPMHQGTIKTIEFRKGTDETSPFVIAVTVEPSTPQIVRRPTEEPAKPQERPTPPPESPQETLTLTADYLPHKPGSVRYYETVWKIGVPDKVFILREKVEDLSGDEVRHTLTDGSQPPFTKPFRRSQDFVEIGTNYPLNVNKQMVWLPMLKLGAVKGTTWAWDNIVTKQKHSFTLKSLRAVGNRHQAIIEEVITSKEEGRSPWRNVYIYTNGVGLTLKEEYWTYQGKEELRRTTRLLTEEMTETNRRQPMSKEDQEKEEMIRRLGPLSKKSIDYLRSLKYTPPKSESPNPEANPEAPVVGKSFPKDVRKLEARVKTVGEEVGGLTVGATYNQFIFMKGVYVADSKVILVFDINDKEWPPVGLCFPLLIRLFDKEGNYLAHFRSAERFTPNANAFLQNNEMMNRLKGVPEVVRDRMDYFEPKLLNPTGNRLIYSLRRSVSQEAAIVEVGFCKP